MIHRGTGYRSTPIDDDLRQTLKKRAVQKIYKRYEQSQDPRELKAYSRRAKEAGNVLGADGGGYDVTNLIITSIQDTIAGLTSETDKMQRAMGTTVANSLNSMRSKLQGIINEYKGDLHKSTVTEINKLIDELDTIIDGTTETGLPMISQLTKDITALVSKVKPAKSYV